MPRIEIIEKDETSAGVYAEATDVVYIPGFVDTTQKCLQDSKGNYIGIEANVPTLFTSVKQFESLCGKSAAVFSEDQLYSDLIDIYNYDPLKGFTNNAIPFHNTMFNAGDSDPSYIMAKEYLNAGLNVVYERVNSNEELQRLITAPKDWNTNYTNYYTELPVVYKSLSEFNVPPLWYEKVTPGTKIRGKYYKVTLDNYDPYKVSEFKEVTYSKDTEAEDGIYKKIADFYFKVDITKAELSEDLAGNPIYDEIALEGTEKGNTEWEPNKYWIKRDNEKIYLKKTEWDQLPSETKVYEDTYICFTSVDGVMSDYITAMNINSYIFDALYSNDYTGGDTIRDMDANPSWVFYYKNLYMKLTYQMSPIPEQVSVPSFNDYPDGVYKYGDGINIKNMYNALEGIYSSSDLDGLADKGNYSIKYLTSGGYPVYEYNNNAIVAKMIDLAVKRGDCVAFIDHTDHSDRDDNIDHRGSVYATVVDDQIFKANGDFATMFTPWASYNRVTVDRDDEGDIIKSSSVRMPASYAYFTALGDSIRTNANWLAIAGSARGVVPNLSSNGMTTNIPNGAADKMQPRDGVAVNAITNIKPYGYTIWGNRTLKNNGEKGNLTATSFLNIRNLISDVKKTTYRVARQLTFEQNNEILWINFKSLIAPTLDRMLSGYGISGYKIVRDTAHEKASEKATVCAKIILYPVYAVEDFYITVVLKDDEVSVE